MKDPDTYLMQVGLRELGFDPGPLDGVAGPKTKAARDRWLTSLDPAVPSSYAALILGSAILDLGIRETSRNQGPGIEKYWPATTYPDGYQNREPYCAAAVCYWISTAAALPRSFDLPRTAVAFGLEKWGKAQAGKGVEMIGKNAELLPGDIVVFEFSHVGIVAARCPKGTVNFQTIEANTSPSSTTNEGGGVYRRTRQRHLIRAIVRITA